MNKKLFNCGFAILLLILLPLAATAQNTRTITGKVIDSKGVPLPGTNVIVAGTTNGTQADMNGNYQITVENPANAKLEFSFIGYAKQVIPVESQSTINASLEEEYVGLNELVVVGYGTVKKKDLTGSVASIKSGEITKTATNNALQSMQGKIAGLDITKESGESGSGINIDLRGNRSINASNAPLFLVDGIEYGSTLDLNASDIASIEVLKDASSTAIYGSRGANGVVIITTKKGVSAAKSKITVNSYISFNSPTNLPRLMSVEQDYLLIAERQRYNAEKGTSAWGTTSLSNYTPDVVLSNVISSPYEKSVYQLYQEGGVNWFDMILRNSVTQNHEISLSGGDAKTSFIISLGYMDEGGLLRNDNLKRYNGRINLDHKITKTLTAGINLQYTYRDWDRRDDKIYTQLIKMHSMAQPYLSDGTILDKPSELATSHTNPLLNEVPGYYSNNTQNNRLFGNLFLEWEIVKGLRFKSLLGIDQQSIREGKYEDYMCTANYQFGRGSSFSALNRQILNYTFENTLNYSLSLGDIHEFQFLAGQSAQQNVNEYHAASGIGSFDHYAKSSFYDLTYIPTASRSITNDYVKSNLLSYFGRVNYKLMGKYLLTATLRADGSSVLSEGNKWSYFPSVAAAWVISDESFVKSINQINNLKLRLSWGKAGNAAIDPYKTLTTLGIDKIPYTYGTILTQGQVPANLGNPDLTWETTTTYDAGLDISVLRERISATIDFYYSQTDGLLLYKALPPSSVYPQVIENVGKTENLGLEAALNMRVIQKKDFTWNSDITFSTNKDKIVSLASGESRDVSNKDQALVVGEPVQAFYNYEADGCWKIDEAAQATIYNKVPGDIKLVDGNNDNVINELDKRLYNKSPRFIVGWNNTVSYKGLSLSALVYSRIGQWIEYDYNTAYKPTEADGSPAVDFWTPENQDAKFPRPGIASQSDMPALAFEKASFLKIREVTLSYSLPETIISKLGISKLRVYSSLQNYFTFSNLNNYDPERGGSISNPLSKQMVFGVNLEF
ncbi:MAG: TonB-dependent receptor [Bacteroidales bacterium]|nr:TonB-dependent receptor [Bacteroidales bacterium]